jgi:undecaprenyl-diphosphatase
MSHPPRLPQPAGPIARVFAVTYRRLYGLVQNAWAALGIELTILVTLATAGLVGFGWLAVEMRSGGLSEAEDRLMLQVGADRTAALTEVARALSFIGSGSVAIPFAVLVVVALRKLDRRADARLYAWVTLSGWAINLLAKAAFRRARPQIIPHLGGGGWYSFPSGHAMLAPLVFGFGAFLLVRGMKNVALKSSVLLLATALVAAIAMSRVYLGVHYPTDVAAALLAGIGWAALCLAATTVKGRETAGVPVGSWPPGVGES